MINQDRRIFARLESRAPLRLKNLETGLTKRVLMRDIGGGGLKFLTTEHLTNLNDLLELWIEPPDTVPIRLKGKVTWVKAVGRELWGVGVRFDKAKLTSLSKVCNSLNAVAV